MRNFSVAPFISGHILEEKETPYKALPIGSAKMMGQDDGSR